MRFHVLLYANLAVWTLLTTPLAFAANPLDELLAVVPSQVADLSEDQTTRLEAQIQAVEQWAGQQWWAEGQPAQVTATVEWLVNLKGHVDLALQRTLQLRTEFVNVSDIEQRRQALRCYLRTTSGLIDLSGRLRYRLNDAVQAASHYLGQQPAEFQKLIELLTERRVGIGAMALSFMLFDPPAESGVSGFSLQEKYRVLQLINATRQTDLIPIVAEFLRVEKQPALIIVGAELLRRLGLPQKPRPDRDPTLPDPPILAEELRGILLQLQNNQLTPELTRIRRELLTWLDRRIERGIVEDTFQLGSLNLRAGDWFLMRNPSPYNLFTDLSPGLFTHVGVVGVEEGSDGIRRFVIVDLPERGSEIPATTVDAYLMRTLHYFFLRHEDRAVCQQMGEAAVAMIGNESQFDLTFQTRRVDQLKGKPLDDALIHTYCAGFLLICAQQTPLPREEFFPIVESPAGGNTVENLSRLGLSIGDDFVSPTGAIFAPHMQIVGRREAMYDPAREVQEAIYDHFADRMEHRQLSLSPDLRQALIQELAEMSRYLPWLASALAKANNVSQRMDLEAAARAASVIETLDEIAEGNLRGFMEARQAILGGPLTPEIRQRLDDEVFERISRYQEQHRQLLQDWSQGKLSARQLRVELVNFYIRQGQAQLDARFFADKNETDGVLDEDRRTGRGDGGNLDR